MTVRFTTLFPGVLTILGACSQGAHGVHGHDERAHGDQARGDHGSGHGHAEDAIAITHYTDRTELFVEYPPLVVGHDSAFAAHLTLLGESFRAVETGRVTVVLSGNGPEERFTADAPAQPGIFRPVVMPRHAGARRLSLRLESGDLSSVHDLGEVTVHADEAAALAAAAAREEGGEPEISFLKEQQWRIDFANAPVERATLRRSIEALGELRARSDGEVIVSAPLAGRVLTAGESFPRLGLGVARDAILATIAPRLEGQSDVATLQLGVTTSSLALEQARRERERLEGLLADGAVPQRRLAEARTTEARAEAELEAARRRLAQHHGLQRAGSGLGGIRIVSPLAGTVVRVQTSPGAFVEEGAELFHVIDLDRLWLEVDVPEADVGRLERPSGAWFEVEGFETSFEAGGDRLVASGGVVDPRTRTVPIVFEVDNDGHRLRVGMAAQVHVVIGEPVDAVVAPESAIVRDGGQPIAFVQVDGEGFERRVLRLGVRDAGRVEVLAGLAPGERVVTRGAYAVRLAGSATNAPSHGHAH
jgi:RND family efflux transporter MFP subunit